MAGKNTKNPLLTGASISFPFENFTNSALLVPIAPQQNESSTLLPEEIEADSFLGQEPSTSTTTKLFSSAQVSKPYSSSSLPGPTSTQQPEPALTPDLHSLPPSLSSIPVFTQSFTGTSSPARPTPVYADALNQQFTQSYTGTSSHSKPTPVYAEALNQQFTQSYTGTSSPAKPTPVYADALIQQFTQNYTGTSSPAIPTPVYADALNQQFNTALAFNSNNSNNNDSIFHINQVKKPESTLIHPPPNQATPLLFPKENSSYTPPSIFTPTPITAPVLLNPSPSYPASFTHTSSPVTSCSPAPQTIFNYFSSEQSKQNNNLPSQQYPSPVTTLPSAPPLLPHPPSNPSASLPPQLSEANVPPQSGSAHNSYRLSNIKRPTYTRPPELSVTPMATMPAPTPPPAAPTSATLFTPFSVDDPTPVSDPNPPYLPSVPAQTSLSSNSASSSEPAILHPAPTPSTLPPLPSSPATVTVTAVDAASPYKTSNPSTSSVLPPSFASLAQGASYRPVYHHWFFKKVVEGKVLWNPFSLSDSLALEEAFTSPTISPDTKVATDGGRYDVEVLRRRRTAVYWEEDPGEVRRCSWFVKGSMDVRFIPYEENVATMLEEEYRIAATSNEWNRHVTLPDGEVIVIHSPNAIAHHIRSTSPDVWGNPPQMQQKPRVVKRGIMDEFDISEGEPVKVDHLLFLVHGIGKFCDLKFRPVTEVVDDFRSVSLQLLQSHFKSAVENQLASRVEVLPVSWHQALHNADIDSRLNNITLRSIPRLRHFTNDTLLDILFYTSPVFCETIVQAVGNELNRLYNLFLSRNPSFRGGVSLGGHSLGSLILFDMLCNQVPVPSPSANVSGDQPSTPTSESQEISVEEEMKALGCMKAQKARLSRTVSYISMGTAGTGQPFISYPQLVFRPTAFFALGSPIGMFVTVRGIESLGEDFALPTCPMFFNIFHPFDPVAYRIESLIKAEFSKYSPVLIPHHKGRKRMHLELKDTLEHVGTALKQRLLESVKNTWNTFAQLAMFQRADGNDHAIEQEVNKVLENEMLQSCAEGEGRSDTPDTCPGPDVKMGKLNGGYRVDYVLQEAPLESFNEYLFALSSHVCYWESEDTMLMMLKEIYGTMGISPDTQVVQQILPFEVPDSSGQLPPAPVGGRDPTVPPSDNLTIGPPPMSGFVRSQK